MFELLWPFLGYALAYLVVAWHLAFATDDDAWSKLLSRTVPILVPCFLGFLAYIIGLSAWAIMLPYTGVLWVFIDVVTTPRKEERWERLAEKAKEPIEDLTAADIAFGDSLLEQERLRVLARTGKHLQLVELPQE